MEFTFGNIPSFGCCEFHVSWSFQPPCILDTLSTVDISPCSPLTCWNVLIFLVPSTFTSFGTFCMLVSSPDHIWHRERLPNLFLISWRKLNLLDITILFAPLARVIERFFTVLSVILGWHFRNPLNHFHPAILLVSLNPGIPFTCANWKAN